MSTTNTRDDVANQIFVSYSRQSANGDSDVYGRITDDDFNGSVTVFTDITASSTSPRGSLGNPGRWL